MLIPGPSEAKNDFRTTSNTTVKMEFLISSLLFWSYWQIIEDYPLVLIVHQSGESCVLMSLEAYNSLGETAYLMRSPTNAKRLMNSIENF